MQHANTRLRSRAVLATSSLLLGASCAAGAADDDGTGGKASSTSDSSSVVTTGGDTASSTGSGFLTSTTGSGGGYAGPSEVFGHSADRLFKLNPDTKAVGIVGTFSGCDGVLDIALDKDSRLLGTTNDGLYEIDKDNAACTLIASGTYPNSLSFMPKGTVDPAVEALVGYVEDANDKNQFVRIDPVSGAITNIGAPWNDTYISSGDIVSVINGPTYLTVKGGNCTPTDCLVEINPANGAIANFIGPLTGYSKVFGMAYWGGSAYGFTNDGKLFEIKVDPDTDVITTTPIAVDASLQFWGAGSTTSAPVVPK